MVSDEDWKSKKYIKNCMKIVIFGRRCAPGEHWKLRKYTKKDMKRKVFGIWWALEIKEIYQTLKENCNFWEAMCAWWALDIKEIYKKLHENESFWYLMSIGNLRSILNNCMNIVIFGRRCAPDLHWKLRKYIKNCRKMKVLGI